MSMLQGHAPATAGNSEMQTSASQTDFLPNSRLRLRDILRDFRYFERVMPRKNIPDAGEGGRVGLDQNPDLVDRDRGVVENVFLAMKRKHDIACDDREKHRPQDEQLVGNDHVGRDRNDRESAARLAQK